MINIRLIINCLLYVLLLDGCSEHDDNTRPPKTSNQSSKAVVISNIAREPFEPQLLQALDIIGLDRSVIVLPKVPYPVSTPSRLELVDQSLADPPSMAGLSRRLVNLNNHAPSPVYLNQLLNILGYKTTGHRQTEFISSQDTDVPDQLHMHGTDSTGAGFPSAAWLSTDATTSALRELLHAVLRARNDWTNAGKAVTDSDTASASRHINSVLRYKGDQPDFYRLLDEKFNATGARYDLGALATSLLDLLTVADRQLPALQQGAYTHLEGVWHTPLGKIKIAGKDDDTHSGEYLLLLDAGGNDTYRDVSAPSDPGNASVIIDLHGNDTVLWERSPGPGTGLQGISIWIDLDGDDKYSGDNTGIGTGIMGAGLLWDARGNDTYESHAISQGVGQHGIGIMLDDHGNDSYTAKFNSQGYGASGGIGVLIDRNGEDNYSCGGFIPDPVKRRTKRHLGTRHLSLCQGFGFGIRPRVSGGIGLLLDSNGNDQYKADIFAQGAAYWFGLGMLIDAKGDDSYETFEHGQGEGLHLAAGILADWEGNDHYNGYEHAQGVGKDRGAGILLDEAGDDIYKSSNESQGAGLSSYGFGLLIDNAGDDIYKAQVRSQGYAGPDPEFPPSEWPTGILLDFGGDNHFNMPYSATVDTAGRVRNKQGIAINYGTNRIPERHNQKK